MVHRLDSSECRIWAYVLRKTHHLLLPLTNGIVSVNMHCEPTSLTLPMLLRLRLLRPASGQRRARKHKTLRATGVRVSQPRPPALSRVQQMLASNASAANRRHPAAASECTVRRSAENDLALRLEPAWDAVCVFGSSASQAH